MKFLRIGSKKKKKGSKNIASHGTSADLNKVIGPDTPFAVKEAYSAVRTKLIYTAMGEKCPIYAVTSSLPGEGKSTNTVNLAITYAQSGKSVLLLDGDMRNPTVHKFFKTSYKHGLSEVLSGISTNVNIHSTTVDNLFFMAAGDIPPNPAELLGSPRFGELMAFLREHFDCVIIDTPPVEFITDATVIAPHMTGFILVVRTGYSKSEVISHTIDTIKSLDGRIVGFVLNDSDGRLEGYYRYGNYGRYGYKYRYNYKYKYNYNYDYSYGKNKSK